MKFRLAILPAVLGSVLVGCGGSGGGSTSPGPATTFSIPIGSPSTDFNGQKSAFAGSTSTFTVDGATVAATLEGGTSALARRLTLEHSGSTAVAVGSTIDVSAGQIRYAETTRQGDPPAWASSSGTITVRNLTDTALTVEFASVVMTAAPGTTATGTFTVNGTYTVRRTVVSVGNGDANLTFSGTANVGLAPLRISHGGTNIVTLTGINSSGQIIQGRATAAGLTTRDFSFTIFTPADRAFRVGDTLSVGEGDSAVVVTFTQMETNLANPQNPVTKSFASTEGVGTVRVVGATADGLVFEFSGVRLAALTEAPSTATGSFTVNGTFGGRIQLN